MIGTYLCFECGLCPHTLYMVIDFLGQWVPSRTTVKSTLAFYPKVVWAVNPSVNRAGFGLWLGFWLGAPVVSCENCENDVGLSLEIWLCTPNVNYGLGSWLG